MEYDLVYHWRAENAKRVFVWDGAVWQYDEVRTQLSELRTTWGNQDDCLIAITDGKRPPDECLRKLPPWRAVLIARVALRAGVMSQEEVDALVAEARYIGGDGTLEEGG